MRRIYLIVLVIAILVFSGCVQPPAGVPTPEVTPPRETTAPTPTPTPAAFSLSNLTIKPAEVQPGEAVTVTVDLTNTGGTEASYTATLMINGVKEADKSVTVAAGGTKTVTFSVTREDAASYNVVVDGLSGSFTVVAPTLTPTPTPAPDTTPPSAITGLVAIDAYDGRVNLWWDKSTAEDFNHYNMYVGKSEIVDVSSMTPVHQITDIATNTYQGTGLEEGTKYYFAVTAVDKSDNESTLPTSVSATPTPMPRGTVDPDIYMDVYHPDLVWAGTTLLNDNHNPERPRIIEVNMLGEIVWEYLVPQNVRGASDVELLPNNNILFVSIKGVYEINRDGEIVWSYLTEKISHDADRLPNGNTIFAFGASDQKSDAQITEVNQKGEVVWAWYAKDHFDKPPYKDIYKGGWTHTNAVTRLPNGNTLISLRNFHFVVEVDAQGSVVRTLGEGIFYYPHDPEIHPNGNILATSPLRGWVVEINPETGAIAWEFRAPQLFPRDADRLPNGNTLITGAARIVEVTPEGKIVWQLTVKGITEGQKAQPEYLYKAERISIVAP